MAPFTSNNAIPSLSQLSAHLVKGKTVIVTGASSGLGLDAARLYAKLGAAHLILAVRTASKGDQAKQSILDGLKASSTDTLPKVDVWILDLASFASVTAFCDRVDNELHHLDIALLNAAVANSEYTPTADGWDETLQTNTLSTVLLALRLLPKLRQSTNATDGWTSRLSFVVARAHGRVSGTAPWLDAPNTLQAINKAGVLTGLGERYAGTKLLTVWAAREIAAKYTMGSDGKPEVIVTYSCPGPCQSDLAREWKGNVATRLLLFGIHKTISKTSEEGARILVLGTLLDEKSHGKFLRDKDVVE
jgi:retinol dehydrogenase-12